MHARVTKFNLHANTPAVVKINEINHKYENTRRKHRLLTNQHPGFLYKVYLYLLFIGRDISGAHKRMKFIR
jgi:hypothetical protein